MMRRPEALTANFGEKTEVVNADVLDVDALAVGRILLC